MNTRGGGGGGSAPTLERGCCHCAVRSSPQESAHGLPRPRRYHRDYRGSAYIYAGQLSFRLTEGDLLAVFSEYGEVVDVNLVRCASAAGATAQRCNGASAS